MGELNKQFEALPLIYQLMDDSFVFVEATQEYTRKNHTEHRLVIATVNGAWYAFQEQQSKIEQLEREKQALHNAFVYMDECRKEWHQGFMRLHKQKNEALKIIENHARYIPQSTVDALEKALRGECE